MRTRITTVSTRALVMMLLGGALCACVAPRVVEQYDEDCQIVARHMTLAAEWPGPVRCDTTARCSTALVGMGVVGTASAIVSGSIVMVGNVVFWMEKQGHCQRKKSEAETSST